MTINKAQWMMHDRTYFGMMMLEMGDCDVFLGGLDDEYPHTMRPALQIIDLKPGLTRVSSMFMMIQKDKLYMFADTTVNVNPTAEEMAEIAMGTVRVCKRFNIEPRIAMLSFSNFGSAPYPESKKVARATELVKQQAPDLMVEGEIQADIALMPDYVKQYFPFSNLKEAANVFIFPDLNSANIAYKLAQRLGGYQAIGPILMGLARPVHVLHRTPMSTRSLIWQR